MNPDLFHPTAPKSFVSLRDFDLDDKLARQALLGIRGHSRSFGAVGPSLQQLPKPVVAAAAYGASTSKQLEVAELTVAELKAKKKAEEQAAKEAAKVEAEAEAAQQARNALAERIYYERGLAHATINLLVTIENVELRGGAAELNPVLATYRSELAPLAATYGFKIVLVGDKTVGVLTK